MTVNHVSLSLDYVHNMFKDKVCSSAMYVDSLAVCKFCALFSIWHKFWLFIWLFTNFFSLSLFTLFLIYNGTLLKIG